MATDDIYLRKKAFLEAQVRRLTTTLGPSREYRAAAASSTVEENERLSETMVDNAIYKCSLPASPTLTTVNLALRKQYRLQYSAQAIRHVATQLSELYKANIDADQETGIHGGESAILLDILSGSADLTDPNVISLMPDVWPAQENDEGQEEYAEQLAELQSLSTALASLQRKQKYYESLLSLTQETLGDPTVDVQPNIITKTGPIADELRKMRTLVAKVTNHLNSGTIPLKQSDRDPDETQDMDLEKWDELSRILTQVNRDGTLDE